MKKLTLSMDEEDIRAARRIARAHGTSISGMFSRLIRLMARDDSNRSELPPLTRQLTGIIAMPDGRTDRDVIEDAILERHGFKA